MKKLLGILVLALLWCNPSYAIGYKIKLLEKNEYGIVFKITIPWTDDPFKWKNTFRKTRETSIKHCNSYSKGSYAFWSQYKGDYARDSKGNFYEEMYQFFGIIQDLQYGTSVRARYFCAENVDEAYSYVERYDDLFKKKFKTKMHIQSILYSKINDDPFNFKNLDNTDFVLNVSGSKTKKVIKKNSNIEEFKKICTDIGLTLGSSDFVDCVLKLKSDEDKIMLENQRLESEENIANKKQKTEQDKQELEEEKYDGEERIRKQKEYEKCLKKTAEIYGSPRKSCALKLL